jgi:predicted MFS family arabinose efflux permease
MAASGRFKGAGGGEGDHTMTETAAAGEESLVTGHGGRLLLLVSFGWFMIQGGRLLLPPLLPEIIADLNVSAAGAGLALTTLWGVYALLQYPSGRLSDRLSRRTLLVGALLVAAVGYLLLSAATVYPLFLLAAGVIGVGAGLYPTAARALVSDRFEQKRAAAFGLHTASGDVGGAVAAGVAVVVVAAAVWRAPFLPVAAVIVAVAVGLHLLSREPYEVKRVDLDVRGAVSRFSDNRRVAALALAYCGFAFSWQSSTGFLPLFLREAKGLSPALASGGFAALFVVGAVVKPVSGGIGDRYGKARVASAAIGFGAVSLAALLLVEGRVAVLAVTVAYAAGLMSFPPVMQSFLMDAFPDDSMGADLGFARSTYIGIGALGPTYVGVVAEQTDYLVAFGGLVAVLGVASVAVFLLSRGAKA